VSTWITAAAVALLVPRFFVDVAIVAINPPPGVQTGLAQFFGAYEVVLPPALLAAVLAVSKSGPRPLPPARWLALLGVNGLAIATGTAFLQARGPPELEAVFIAFAVLAIAMGSLLALGVSPGTRTLGGTWWGGAFLALIALVSVAFAMRAAAFLGVGTAATDGGPLRGNWFLVNVPTLSLELLAVSVWLTLLLGKRRSELRQRWFALLPFLGLPLFAAGFALRPGIAGTALSATITWGANLAVFSPPEVSLGLAVGALACYASSFLLVPRKGRRAAWNLLLLGSLGILMAGFWLSPASVEGLTLGVLAIAVGFSQWTAPPS
jgi:hypothetical protein